jgi:serine acetyltransferase
MYLVIAERNSPSDEEITCIELKVSSGNHVALNDVVAELEGAKAIFEIIADVEGYFYPFISKGQITKVGALIGVITPEKIDGIELEKIYLENSGIEKIAAIRENSGINFSAAASILVEKLDEKDKDNLMFAMKDRSFIREKDVVEYLNSQRKYQRQLSDLSIEGWNSVLSEMKGLRKVVFIGGGYGAVQVLDLMTKKNSYDLVGFFSDNHENVLDDIGVPKLGSCNKADYESYLSDHPDVLFAITVGMSPAFRFTQTKILLGLGVNLPNMIHPSTVIGKNADFGVGNIIFANVHIGADVSLGNSNFISSNSTIEHHNSIGDGNCFGPQISTSGNVRIGSKCRFGSGVVVEPGIEIGSEVTIASHATITSNVQDSSVVKLISSNRIIKHGQL